MKNVKKNIAESTTLKIVIIVVLIVLFMIPSSMIKDLIREREVNELEVKKEIGSIWGEPQLISGPFLVIPYSKKIIRTVNDKKEVELIEKELHILPQKLDISGTIDPVIRKRGIYKATLYNATLKYNGEFKMPDFKRMDVDSSLIKWKKAVLNVGIADMSGIKEPIILKWDDSTGINLEPGIKGDISQSGASAIIPISLAKKENVFKYKFDVKIQGSESISFLPLGKTSTVSLNSSWDSPSFQGKFSADNHEISSEGFTANWKILDMNRNYPQQWTGKNYLVNQSKFGVRLIKPVGEYQKNMRSIKYSVLIIVFTFLVFFFFEVLGKFKIHPIQYSFIGLALTMFFVLLLSISEQLGFNLAYLISAIATSTMILVYSFSLLSNKKQLIALMCFLITIYTFIYIVLQMEDYALLAGSIGLFVALFATMYYSRKIDWYNISLISDEDKTENQTQ